MIPDISLVKKLWDKYQLPENKRVHVTRVAQVAGWLAGKLKTRIPEIGGGVSIDEPLLVAAALLHDIDKNLPQKSGERHPDAAVRVLSAEHLPEVAALVRNHSLHCILADHTAPKSWEEKLLFLADKMVKYEIISVDERFALWREEKLPDLELKILDGAYPRVKALEKEIFSFLGIDLQSCKSAAGEYTISR